MFTNIHFADRGSAHRIAVLALIIGAGIVGLEFLPDCAASEAAGFTAAICGAIAAICETIAKPYSRQRFLVFGAGGIMLMNLAAALAH